MNFMNTFSERLTELRKERGLTQEDLESDSVSRSMISLVEIVKSDLTVSTAKAIADSLGIPMKTLFDFEE